MDIFWVYPDVICNVLEKGHITNKWYHDIYRGPGLPSAWPTGGSIGLPPSMCLYLRGIFFNQFTFPWHLGQAGSYGREGMRP